jgi:hypothetical protein
MTIKIEELNLLQGEANLKAECVFLEKTDKPTSRTGKGIMSGILLLTTKRLFFLGMNRGKSMAGKTAVKVVGGLAADILDHFTLGFASLIESGIEIGIEHFNHKKVDYTQYCQNEASFVLPIEKIVDCEKFGGRFVLSTKSLFVKLTIMNDFGIRESYCIYCVSPKNQSGINYKKWFEEINRARKMAQVNQYNYNLGVQTVK